MVITDVLIYDKNKKEFMVNNNVEVGCHVFSLPFSFYTYNCILTLGKSQYTCILGVLGSNFSFIQVEDQRKFCVPYFLNLFIFLYFKPSSFPAHI